MEKAKLYLLRSPAKCLVSEVKNQKQKVFPTTWHTHKDTKTLNRTQKNEEPGDLESCLFVR